jgi:hypothetical protein
MAAPTWVASSAGITDSAGAWAHTGPAPGAAGRILITQLLQDGTNASAPTITSVTNAENLVGTDNVFTFIGSFDVGSPVTAKQLLWIGRSLSTSAPVITGSNVGGDDVYVQMHEFQDVNTGVALADVIENSTAGSTSNGTGTGTTVSDTAVVTLDVDRLALNLTGGDDDPTSFAGTLTGQSGGTWVQRASFGSSTGTDGSVNLNTAAMAAAGTIDGGTYTVGTSFGWGVVGFALIGTTAAGPTTSLSFGQQGFDRDRYGLMRRASALRPKWKRERGIWLPDRAILTPSILLPA